MALAPWIRPIAYCENDRFAQAVLLSRMRDGSLPDAPIWDDVTTLVHSVLPGDGSIDIIYGGFPCQDISIAGAGRGLEGERSGLFFEILRLAKEVRPSFIFLENVPAIRGRGAFRIIQEFSDAGYDSRWLVISASYLGAHHQRDRWFLLAHSNANRTRLSEPRRLEEPEGERTRSKRRPSFSLVQGDVWPKSPSDICGMDDGIPPKTHRLRGLGNAVVPIQAREAFMRLSGCNTIGGAQ